MPAPYSNLYQAFFRQGVTKTFTQGYAQSVVAATHPHVLNPQNRPSFARRNSNRFSRVHALQLQSAFHTERTVSAGLSDHRHDRSLSHGGLDAYYEALQKQHASGGEDVDKEWTQFQFPKQIEWKPTPASIVGETSARTPGLDLAAHDGETSRTISTADEAALAHIDAALREEIEARQSLDPLEEEDGSVLSVRTASPLGSEVARPRVSRSPSERPHTPASIARSSTPPVDPQSQRYADHLSKLAQNGRHAEVPAVFEAMLVAGVAPTSQAYNALLSAAIHVPTEKTEVVSKALDVYTDMIRRKIQPDSETYGILVGLLASRSVEVKAAKKALETLRIRFGGMDEPGKFMLASSELEYAILSENDRLDLAVKLFDDSVACQKAFFDAETYHVLITACAESLRVPDMIRLFEHMETSQKTPYAATFAAMITAFAKTENLVSAVECYNEYRALAIANDIGQTTLDRRNDADVYSAVIHAYIISDKPEGASKFFRKIVAEYGVSAASISDALIRGGFVQAFTERRIFQEALQWAQAIENELRAHAMRDVAIQAADNGDKATAIAAFANIPLNFVDIATPAVALMAMSVRNGDVASATKYWRLVSNADIDTGTSMIEPTVMYAIALIGTGEVAEGLAESDRMFRRIQSASTGMRPQRADEIEEGVELISRFMKARGIVDPRQVESQAPSHVPTMATPAYPVTQVASGFRDSFDPYAHSTDFKGSSIIADELEDGHGRKARGLGEALARFRNMRRAGRHPRYVTYAKLISAAAREGKSDLCHEILAMARKDVPFLAQYPVVHWGWSCILDAMVGASLTTGNRDMAEQFHRELISMGSAPSANTYGLYITTLKESTKTFDEASEAVKIFHRAKAEGVEPSSFLYNALIGKLGKARRIDDCLFYFAEMRALGIKPTSVTYGTIVNALCRVSDEKFAEELFDEMEAMPNYKARPAPYNSMMQFFLTTKRDKAKVIAYYNRMMVKGIAPTAHTYKLLVDTHATLEPVDMAAAEDVLVDIKKSGQRPEAVHYASLIHARGCVLHDVEGARALFDTVLKDRSVPANACLFQALFEAMVANHQVAATEPILGEMRRRGVEITPYIANTLIHGWAAEKNIDRARDIYGAVGHERREPSTYEAMTRAYLAVEQRDQAKEVVDEMLGRGYPVAVVNKVLELVGGGATAEA